MRLFMAGGGTGGHLFPGLALADCLRKNLPDIDIHFIGSKQGLDAKIIPDSGYNFHLLSIGRGALIQWKRPLNIPRFALACTQSFRLLQKYRPDAVIALGGYAAAAPGLAAAALKIPLFVLEQNTVPGRVNRLLARFAESVYLQFSEASDYFPYSPEIHVVGSPLRQEILQAHAAPPVRGDTLLVMGGSQGAANLNKLVLKIMPAFLNATDAKVVHIAGEANVSYVTDLYNQVDIKAERLQVYGFVSDAMSAIYQQCRLAISRCGALSLAELAAFGIPALLVPLPSAADNHQYHNACSIQQAGGGLLFPETTTDPEVFAKTLIELWGNQDQLNDMSLAMRATLKPDAAEIITKRLFFRFGQKLPQLNIVQEEQFKHNIAG